MKYLVVISSIITAVMNRTGLGNKECRMSETERSSRSIVANSRRARIARSLRSWFSGVKGWMSPTVTRPHPGALIVRQISGVTAALMKRLVLFAVLLGGMCWVQEAQAQIAFLAMGTATVTSGNLTINKPTGTVQDNVMIAAIAVRPDTATITAPSGWTLVRKDTNASAIPDQLNTYSKVAGASEPASYSWTIGVNTGAAGGILSFSGVNTASPIDVSGGQQVIGTTTSIVAPSVNTTEVNTMLVTFHCVTSSGTAGSAWTPPTGMTEAVDISSESANTGESLGINYVVQAAAGATGTKTAMMSGHNELFGLGQILALRPLKQNDIFFGTNMIGDAGWQYRKQITITGTMTANTTQTNFPLMVRRTSDSNLAIRAQSDGDDILFTSSDGITKLDHEIEKYVSSTGELWSWVRIPTLTTATSTVFMYYGNAAVASQQNATGVWDSNYKAVWHLKEDQAVAGASGIKDSTSNANNGTDNGGMNAADQVDGKVDGSFDFDGVDDYVNAGSSSTLSFTATASQFSISAWVKVASYPFTQATIISKWAVSNRAYMFALQNNGSVALLLSTTGAGATQVIATADASFSSGVLHHIVATADIGTDVFRIYIDGAASSTTGSAAVSSLFSSTADVLFSATKVGTDDLYNGVTDEVRISDSVRSADWITTEYNNQNAPDTYITFGSEERAPANAVFFGTNF